MTDLTKSDGAVERLTEFASRNTLSIIDQISMIVTGEATVDALVDDIQTVLDELRDLRTANDALLHKAADQAGEIERLRKLDAEYGRVELAILIADQFFDGDSDHANCGDRLVASVERFSEQIAAKNAEVKRLRSALEFYADPKTWTPNGHPQIDSDTKPIVRDGGKVAREALKGGQS